MSKPLSFPLFLSQLFGNDDITMMAAELSIDPENLTGGKSNRARQLYDQAVITDRLDDLLHLVSQLRPTEQLQPYLYLLIARYFKSSESMQRLAAALRIDYKTELLDPFNLFHPTSVSHAIVDQSWRIYEICEEQDRLGEIVSALREERPALKLDIFAHLIPVDSIAKPTEGSNLVDNNHPIKQLEYGDFVIRIRRQLADGRFPIEVGANPEKMEIIDELFIANPLDDFDFEDLVGYLKDLKAGSEKFDSDTDTLKDSDAKALGKKMRALLFPEKIWTLFFANYNEMRKQSKGLRIRLRIDSPKLSGLPWEYCYDDEFGFFAQNALTPVVRYMSGSFPSASLTVPAPLKILVVASEPSQASGWAPLSVDKELRLIKDICETLGSRVELHIERNATETNLRNALEKQPHIFHFIGHGEFKNGKGSLVFVNDFGDAELLDADELKGRLSNKGIKFAVLNACKSAAQNTTNALSGVAASLIRADIPAVMAMQFNVPDKLALRFTYDLYRYLLSGDPLDKAVTELRIGAFNEDQYLWGIPTLYMRSGNGVLWPRDPQIAAALNKISLNTLPDLLDDIIALVNQFTIEGQLDDRDSKWLVRGLEDAKEALSAEAPDIADVEKSLNRVIADLLDTDVTEAIDAINPKVSHVLKQAKEKHGAA